MAEQTDIVLDGKKLSQNELLEILEEDEDSAFQAYDIFALPPCNASEDVTDEDSGSEEYPTIDRLPGSQLRAEAIIKAPEPSSTVEQAGQKNSSPNRKSELGANKEKKCMKRAKKSSLAKEYKWSKLELCVPPVEWLPLQSANAELKFPLEYFKLFFDKEVLHILVTYTNQYAAKRNKLGDVSEKEMWSFIGILLLSGYNVVSRRQMYWEQEDDTHNSVVAESLSRDRFDFIMSNLHVCNNDQLDKNDRFAKVRTLYNLMNEKFKLFAPHHQHHSVDEQMVPYFGKHGCKQFIRGKPIRFGYKFWAGGTSDGYIIWVEPYQGAGTCNDKYADKGLGYSVVMSYVDELPMKETPYQLYFDNLFTSITLLKDLKERAVLATGTIRMTSVPKSCPPEVVKKNGNRGSYEIATDENSGVMLVRWHDNSVVTAATNFSTTHPLKKVPRFSRKEKKTVTVQQPNLLYSYNKGMGGIDRADQNISLYRVSIRGKKWYFPLIAHAIDLAEQNAWHLYKKDGGKLDHLAFRRSVATSILKSNKKVSTSKGRPSKKLKVDSSRYDGMEHFVADLPFDEKANRKKQLHCRHCSKKCSTICIKCDCPLHVSCFLAYHT